MGLSQAPGSPWEGAAPTRVNVEIGELVLDGFERVDRDAVAGAFCAELGRLLRREAGRLLAQGAAGGEAGAGDVRAAAELPRGMSSRRLGRSLARAAFRAVDGIARAGDMPTAAVPAVLARGDTAPSVNIPDPDAPGSHAPAGAASAAAVTDDDAAPSAGQARRGAL